MAVRTSSVPEGTYTLSFIQGSFKKTTSVQLPIADNTPEAFGNAPGSKYSIPAEPWPAPFDTTTHKLHLGDARNLSWIPDESVHLVVTSPPYWTLKEYNHTAGQMGHIESYEHFLDERDTVWAECIAYSFQVGESAALSATYVFHERRPGGTSLCRSTRTSKCAPAL